MKALLTGVGCLGFFLVVGAAGASDNGADGWEPFALAIVGLVFMAIAVKIGRRLRDNEDQ